MGRHEAALINLEKAQTLLPQDTTGFKRKLKFLNKPIIFLKVTSLLNSVKAKVKKDDPVESKKDRTEVDTDNNVKETEEKKNKPLKKKRVELDSLNDPKLDDSKHLGKEFKEKEKEWEKRSHYLNSKKTGGETTSRPDVTIEEEIPTAKTQSVSNQGSSLPPNMGAGLGRANINPEQAKSSLQQLKNMV